MVPRADLRLLRFFKFINSNRSESHPNTSIILLHASNFCFMKMEVYSRGIISVSGLGDGTLGFSLAGLPHSQDKVSGCGVGTYVSFGMEGGTAASYF